MRRLTAAQRTERLRRGERMARALLFAEMSQADLARQMTTRSRSGRAKPVSQAYIGQLVMGERPGSSEQWERIATITGVPLSYISEGRGWTPPPRATATSAAPATTVPLPVDADLMSILRAQGSAAFRLSAPTARALTKLLKTEINTDQIDGQRSMVLVVLEDTR